MWDVVGAVPPLPPPTTGPASRPHCAAGRDGGKRQACRSRDLEAAGEPGKPACVRSTIHDPRFKIHKPTAVPSELPVPIAHSTGGDGCRTSNGEARGSGQRRCRSRSHSPERPCPRPKADAQRSICRTCPSRTVYGVYCTDGCLLCTYYLYLAAWCPCCRHIPCLRWLTAVGPVG